MKNGILRKRMKNIPNNRWYLWKRISDKKNPWDRYLNNDFLKTEWKRIKNIEIWKKNFHLKAMYLFLAYYLH